jgi:hypothetical protein
VIPALLSSLPVSLIGFWLFPRLFDAEINGIHSETIVDICLVLVFMTIVIVSLAYLFESIKTTTKVGREPRSFRASIQGLCVLSFLFALSATAISLVYGLLAVLIYNIANAKLSFDEIKGIINIVTSIITIMILPVFLHTFFVYGLGSVGVKASIGAALRTLRGSYLKGCVFLFLCFAAGCLLLLVFSFMPQSVFWETAKIILLGLLGAGILIVYTMIFIGGRRHAS